MSKVRSSQPVSVNPLPPTAPVRAPLVGIVAGIALVGGLAAWTFQRIGEAKTMQSGVELKRNADTEKAAALAREPAKVEVVRGVVARWQPHVDLEGSLQAQHEAMLGFKVGGRLSRVTVEVGDQVRAGALLGQLDQLEAVAQSRAAEAQIRAAEATLSLAEDGERRTLPLVKSGSFAEASGVQATSQRQLALAQLDSARAQHALAVAGVSNHALAAPFAGTITQAPTGVGAVVAPGQPLFGLVDTSKLKLSTTVTEDEANLLEVGANVHVATRGAEAIGRVSAILSTLDPRTRRVPVVAEFDNDGKGSPQLRAGSFVRAWVQAHESIDVLRLPHGVLRPGSRDEVVRVDPATSQLEIRRIAFAVDKDGSLLARSGISVDDQLVLNPVPEASSGDLVRIEAPTDELSAPGDAASAPAPTKPAAASPTKTAAMSTKPAQATTLKAPQVESNPRAKAPVAKSNPAGTP